MAALVPIWLSIVFLVLTGLSFTPQLARFWTGKGVRDISLFYVFFNLVSANEQFTILLFLVPLFGDDPIFDHERNLSDWLNFAQTSLVFLMFLILFVLCLVQSSSRLVTKLVVIVLFLADLLGTVVLAVALRLDSDTNDGSSYKDWARDLFIGGHMYFIHRFVTFFSAMSLFFQLGRARAMSSTGLLAQAVVFALVAVSWLARLPWNTPDLTRYEWYAYKGWAFVDNAVFAAVQLVLFLVGRYGPEDAQQETMDRGTDGEREPLLRG